MDTHETDEACSRVFASRGRGWWSTGPYEMNYTHYVFLLIKSTGAIQFYLKQFPSKIMNIITRFLKFTDRIQTKIKVHSSYMTIAIKPI